MTSIYLATPEQDRRSSHLSKSLWSQGLGRRGGSPVEWVQDLPFGDKSVLELDRDGGGAVMMVDVPQILLSCEVNSS